MKPKSDIWGWQHLWGPKDLLNKAYRPIGNGIPRSERSLAKIPGIPKTVEMASNNFFNKSNI